MQNFLKINEKDRVVVALRPIPAGEAIAVESGGRLREVTAREDIPAGHKMAICDIRREARSSSMAIASEMRRRISRREPGYIRIM